MQISALFKQRWFLCSYSLFAFTTIIAITACTTVHKNFKAFSPAKEMPLQTESRVVLVLPGELCSLYYKPRDFQEFSLGPVVCENAGIAARAVFGDLLILDNEQDAGSVQADFVGTLRPRDVWLYTVRKIPARVITGAVLSWELRSADGKRLYGATIRGDGEDQRTFGMADVRYESSMQRCMDDLAANLHTQLAGALQRAAKNVAASNLIRQAIEECRIGITTYADYKSKKDESWRIYALQELARLGDVDYGYELDPGANSHVSSIGSWATKWGRNLPVMTSLRPSVYLPESRIDHLKINSVYIKELVGSAYDDHPLCELVFEGNNFETLKLTQLSCQKDYLAADKYMSADIHQGHTPNQTALQWLELRPGMSREEVGALIGPPKNMVYNSATKTTVHEYGYGRLRFNDNGLSTWRLD